MVKSLPTALHFFPFMMTNKQSHAPGLHAGGPQNPSFSSFSAQILRTAQHRQLASCCKCRITGSSTASPSSSRLPVPAASLAIAGVFVERNSKTMMLVFTSSAWKCPRLPLPDYRGASGGAYFYIFTLFSGHLFFAPAEASIIPLVVKRNNVAANSLFNHSPGTQRGGVGSWRSPVDRSSTTLHRLYISLLLA